MEDDLDSGRKLDSVLVEWEIEGKGMFKWETWGKGCMSSSGLKRHQGMKHKNTKALPEKFSQLTASEFSSLMKKWLNMSARFMFNRGYKKEIWFLWFYW